MTPEQRAKIHALRYGTEYVPPKEYHREMPKSVQAVRQQINFKKLFEERKSK
jgi:hypothetical protein